MYMTTTYPCPFCACETGSFEQIERHIDTMHPKRMDEAMQLFYRKLTEGSTMLIPFASIKPEDLALIKGDYEYDHANEALRVPCKGNEWLVEMLINATQMKVIK